MTFIREPSLEAKVAFLRRPSSYPHHPVNVSVTQTHMSWVFLADSLVYKLKKPVSYPFLDFATLGARERNCREEVRLNARLAKDIYLGVTPLYASDTGALSFESVGEVADWLVQMRRLPADLMLDDLIGRSALDPRDVARAAEKLASFYKTSPPVDVAAEWALARFALEHEEDRRLLLDGRFALEVELTHRVLRMMGEALIAVRPLIEMRAAQKAYVEGHGDLRPEHICLSPDPVFFDCLEFNRDLRLVDPFDEIAYLGLECERLGAAWVGETFLSTLRSTLDNPPPERLLQFYRASRALLRARLSLAHLVEPHPRTPEKWESRAREYVRLAERASRKFANDEVRCGEAYD